MASTQRAAAVAVPAVLLLLCAVSFRESSAPRAEELVAAAGLQQTGAGLALHKWDITSGRDARLSDQINHWDKSGASLKSAGPGFVPAKGTQQLVQVPGGDLSKQIKTAVNTLRLSDFLTGVKSNVVQHQVQGLYQKMDPHDTTGWMSRQNLHRMSPAQVQARRVKTYKTMLQKELSTTPNQDSPKAKKARKELRELIQRKAALRQSVNAEMRKEMHHTSSKVWTRRAARNGADDSDYLIHQIASPEDRHASYAKWLRSAKKGGRGRHHTSGSPRLTAGGQLQWRKQVHAHLKQKQARLQKLSQDDTAHSRMQALSEDENKVGASEIAMRQILGKAKKAAHSYVDEEEDQHDATKQAEAGRDFAAPHQQLAVKRAAISGMDVVSDAEEGVSPQNDTPESIRERAALKVSRWMGGGYVDVYGR